VAVIGNGYVGTVTTSCLTWLGHRVTGLEMKAQLAEQLSAGQVHFHEPGLSSLLSEALATGRLDFTADPEAALEDAEIIFVCVGTPPGLDGSPDLTQVGLAARAIAGNLREGAVVVMKSTVPVGTGERVRELIEDNLETPIRFSVVSNPEFLREGSAIEDFLHPDRIVVGGDGDGVRKVLRLFQSVIDQSFPGGDDALRPDVFATDLRSAEMVKYAANAFLAAKISFANEIASLCEQLGADAREVLPAVGADARIGAAFLRAGIGWGGSCFPKDTAALVGMGETFGQTPRIVSAAIEVNEAQRKAVVDRLAHELRGLSGKRIAVLGLAFKPDTDDIRESPALDLINRLRAAGAEVRACDPVVKYVPDDGRLHVTPDPYDAAEDAHAVVLVTEWPQFADIDFELLGGRMSGDLILDGRNFLDPRQVAGSGLRLAGIGWCS
jgi:nucleotide sugar dehydrogenase